MHLHSCTLINVYEFTNTNMIDDVNKELGHGSGPETLITDAFNLISEYFRLHFASRSKRLKKVFHPKLEIGL